ncbi:hypothetical protein [Halorarius halobius]|uniref:hypothetical protein n=1 Tax=Halorarius halobius TaxID=2962671 RepID=UPI0020CF5BCF|nr:hypothetical protein [Halorarius halobius]
MVAVETLVTLGVVAFAGGALGAALGGLRAYGLAGVAVLVGQATSVANGIVAAAGGDPAALGTTGITAALGFGPALGPHVAFAGGAAAAAYAGRGGGEDGFEYHAAKRVGVPVGTDPDVLAVGGVFGLVGYGLAVGLAAVGVPTDPISLSIVLSALLHRVAFGYPLVGEVRHGLLDMSPYERREHRPRRPGAVSDAEQQSAEEAATAGTRYVVEPWLPDQSEWANVTLLGFVVGAFAAFVTYETGAPFLAFGITAATLLVADSDGRVPVVHHMALPAGVVVVALVGAADPTLLDGGLTPAELESAVQPYLAVLAGGVLGIVAGVVAELAQRTLYAHADTHLDPAAAGIVVSVLLVGLLELAGVVTTGGILPMP